MHVVAAGIHAMYVREHIDTYVCARLVPALGYECINAMYMRKRFQEHARGYVCMHVAVCVCKYGVMYASIYDSSLCAYMC